MNLTINLKRKCYKITNLKVIFLILLFLCFPIKKKWIRKLYLLFWNVSMVVKLNLAVAIVVGAAYAGTISRLFAIRTLNWFTVLWERRITVNATRTGTHENSKKQKWRIKSICTIQMKNNNWNIKNHFVFHFFIE